MSPSSHSRGRATLRDAGLTRARIHWCEVPCQVPQAAAAEQAYTKPELASPVPHRFASARATWASPALSEIAFASSAKPYSRPADSNSFITKPIPYKRNDAGYPFILHFIVVE